MTADKGFDSESNRAYAHGTGVKSIISLRYRTTLRKTKGFYTVIRSYFPEEKYNRRVIIETINPVEKKKFEYFQEQEVENAKKRDEGY